MVCLDICVQPLLVIELTKQGGFFCCFRFVTGETSSSHSICFLQEAYGSRDDLS